MLLGVVIDFLQTDFSIRSCASTDLPALLEIETGSYPRPWSELQFQQELDATYSRIDLLLSDGELAGYICYWLAADEMHILNVATAPAFRRRGVARRLFEHALEQAKELNVERACLEVRAGNAGAIALYRDFGFCDDCVRRGYYTDGEDALLMSCALDSRRE